jgi:hypothetical protein
MIDKHALAIVSIVGSSLDVIGSLYLAYDLLGGDHGPLRTLTRAVTYGILFGVGYGIALGPLFGLINGLAHGITLGWEFSRIARQKPEPGFWFDLVMSAIRGCGYGLGTAFLFGAKFGITFGALSTIGQIIGYQLGIRPSATYPASTRPRMTGLLFLGVLNRAVGYSIAGYLSSLVGNQHARAWALGIEAGLLVGLVSAVAVFWMPFIEWSADHMPARRMGVLGVVLIVIGFALQSVQYWVTLLGPHTN